MGCLSIAGLRRSALSLPGSFIHLDRKALWESSVLSKNKTQCLRPGTNHEATASTETAHKIHCHQLQRYDVPNLKDISDSDVNDCRTPNPGWYYFFSFHQLFVHFISPLFTIPYGETPRSIFSTIRSAVSCLITALIVRKFIRLVNFVIFNLREILHCIFIFYNDRNINIRVKIFSTKIISV